MIWQETAPELTITAEVELALLRQALAADPDQPARHADLGTCLLRAGDVPAARDALETALRLDRNGFRAWDGLAQCHLALGDARQSLRICDLSKPGQETAALHFQRGSALQALDRHDEARASFKRALALGDPGYDALRALLKPLARDPGGGPLLAFCDTLPPGLRRTAVVLAHRGIALSRLGREAEARALIDLDRHVLRVRFDPPAEYGGIACFNDMLAREILDDPARTAQSARPFDILYEPRVDRQSALSALLAFTRSAMEDYADSLALRGPEAMLPAPEAASLFTATLVLRGDGSNGEHIHRFGYISTVYHVLVPDDVAEAEDLRGALVLGACDLYTGGYQPCWGKKHIRPEAGWLTVFPSHVFHDVVPSRATDPRISISSDLRAIAPADRG